MANAEEMKARGGTLHIRTVTGRPVENIAEIARGLPPAALQEILEGRVVSANTAGQTLFVETEGFFCFVPFTYDGEAMGSPGTAACVPRDADLDCILYREDAGCYCIFQAAREGLQLVPRCTVYTPATQRLETVFDLSRENSLLENFRLRDDVEITGIFAAYNNALRRFVLAYGYSTGGAFKLYEHKFSLEGFAETLQSCLYSDSPGDFS